MVELSVVIPAFNAAATLGAQLCGLQSQQWSGTWEVVVADNGSTDETALIVAAAAESDTRIRLVDASGCPGASHARNQGVRAARGTSIAFCDADDVVGEGWLAAMAEALRTDPFVTGPQEFECLNESWLHGAFGTRTASAIQTFAGIFPFGPTANLGIERELLDRVGGFDESVAPHEDIELCLRVWLEGVPLRYVPEAVVHYRYRTSMMALWRQSVAYGSAAPDLARRLDANGREGPPRWRGAKNWLWLTRNLPTLRSKAGRARWIVVAGNSSGRLLGSIRSRHVML